MIEPTFKEIVDIFSSFENVSKSTPFTDDVDVYKVDDQMFALVVNNKLPIRLSLRCDQNLSKVLLEKYESVMLGQKLDQEKWITIVLRNSRSNTTLLYSGKRRFLNQSINLIH
jgi:predicted DNA-binding protein (MmcQ/YjbR family)